MKKPVMVDGVEHWRCPKCGEVKPPDDFGKSASSSNGLFSWCRACVRAKGSSPKRIARRRELYKADPYAAREWQADYRHDIKVSNDMHESWLLRMSPARRSMVTSKVDVVGVYPRKVTKVAMTVPSVMAIRRTTIRTQYRLVPFALCGDCGRVLPRAEFYSSMAMSRGVTAICRECTLVRAARPKARKINRGSAIKFISDSCEACGWVPPVSTYGLNNHHIIPRAEGGPDTVDNIITLCACCHAIVHGLDYSGDPSLRTRSDIVDKISTIIDR